MSFIPALAAVFSAFLFGFVIHFVYARRIEDERKDLRTLKAYQKVQQSTKGKNMSNPYLKELYDVVDLISQQYKVEKLDVIDVFVEEVLQEKGLEDEQR
jgi:hypothetical protein